MQCCKTCRSALARAPCQVSVPMTPIGVPWLAGMAPAQRVLLRRRLYTAVSAAGACPGAQASAGLTRRAQRLHGTCVGGRVAARGGARVVGPLARTAAAGRRAPIFLVATRRPFARGASRDARRARGARWSPFPARATTARGTARACGRCRSRARAPATIRDACGTSPASSMPCATARCGPSRPRSAARRPGWWRGT